MQIRSVGIDLGKTTFHLVALGTLGKVIVKRKPWPMFWRTRRTSLRP
jgi:hypothetical protein